MADDGAPGESRWDRIRVRLISVALLVAIVAFLARLAEDGPDLLQRALPDADPAMMAIFLVPAAFFLIPAAIMARDTRRIRSWPRVAGVVVSTAVASMRRPRSPAVSRRPVVRYRYGVDGVEREGDTLRFGRTEGGSDEWARKVLARYPVGSAVAVYCNPADPRQTSLEAAMGSFGWALLVVGLLCVLAAIMASGLI